MADKFLAYSPRTEDYWRGIILFGRNVASYKFALGRALLDLAPAADQLIPLEELAVPFASHVCDHLKLADKQGTFQTSRFLEACRKRNLGELGQQDLIDTTVRLGFNNVIDAFHIVAGDEIPLRFFIDERNTGKGIRVTDSFLELMDAPEAANLPVETEARWRLVETAWQERLTPSLLTVRHDPRTETLFVIDSARRRQSITGARDALSGYQKGHCFYCFDSFELLGPTPPDIDHFFPHTLKAAGFGSMIDGVWNLVLSCPSCNRGVGGKFDKVPTLNLLERLSTRNEFLISSHHPLRETLITQTGRRESDRRSFLNKLHMEATALLLRQWEPDEVADPLF